MLLYITLNSIIEVLAVIVPVLLTVAFVTILERKSMASMQRRLGPNIVGVYGSLQAFADALKLLLKEYISPTQANLILFFLGPIITLVFSLLGFAVIPFGPGLAIIDFSLAILYVLAVSSLSTYGILLAGWSANSKYAFLGSLRSTAQLISYELILSSAILLVVLLTGSLSLTVNIEAQRAVWYILPLVSMFIVFLIGAIAETNRAPFDLAEAESELVSGFMTEHAAVIFVFFFLAEYGSIVLICTILATLFIGGYLLDITSITYLINSCINCLIDYLYIIITIIEIDFDYILDPYHHPFSINPYINSLNSYHIFHQHSAYDEYKPLIPDTGYQSNVFDYLLQGIFYGFLLGLKVFFMIFVFIWGRASFPRIRFDQLMSLCWTILLPIVI
uniref:NADH-ubiquinone oxidoreductase chain 1 n=1 Tax=Phaeoplaca camptidia TaxID=2488735 RepID=A0A8K1SPB5_9LECA|nr:NADH dehydrogenase subunit 1 [Phaeoplaca camptidia]